MSAHDWYIENRTPFVTRTLDGDEQSLFADHLARCADCQVAVAALELELAWLPMGVTPVVPRPGLARRFAERVLHERPSRWWRWAAAVATAASLLLAVRVSTEAHSRITQLSGALAVSQGQLNAIKDSLSAIVGAERVLQETVRRDGYEGGFLIFYDQDTERWNVVVHDLPPARAGEEYQLWFITSRGLLPGPALQANGARPTFLTLPAPGRTPDVVGAVLVVGPPEGVSGRPRGVELARVTF
ncbi:MAG TPA: anti-sigma factor [Gemmatimonadales bacterium]|nr:anti-sigma factor [Gemmatimonadales bacterium]